MIDLHSKISSHKFILVILLILCIGIGIGFNVCSPKATTIQSCSKNIEIKKNYEPNKPRMCTEKPILLGESPGIPPKLEPTEDQCFCELQGTIDDCTCQIDTVDTFNNYKLHPRLQSLLAKDYFRYFQVNLRKDCPFWADDSQCALESCQVKECQDDEVPSGLKGKGDVNVNNRKLSTNRLSPCKDDLGYINTTISEESQEGFERWQIYDKSQLDFCTVRDDEIDSDLQYVDLLLNPERYTGYRGPSAHRIWQSIYLENCFKQSSTSSLVTLFEKDDQEEFCIEKRAFYRAISGLHASINIHLSAKYLLSDSIPFIKSKSEQNWGPNLAEFRQRFDGTLTQGQGSSWLKNLYFLYLLELKAIWKLSPFLSTFNFYTGNPEEDLDVSKAIRDFLGVIDKFPSHFEESMLFSRNDAAKLKDEFHKRFTNITRIMDCVGCQKCKLWGKIQVKGLGTALKILFSEPFSHKRIGRVSRNEIVSLLNSFGRLSESIYELDNFRHLIKEEKERERNEKNGKSKSGKNTINGLFSK